MTGHQYPHMTKASTRSAKTHVKAQQEGNQPMSESTAPLARAHQLIVAAGVALEEAIDTPTTGVEAQVMAAARALLDLRTKRDHLDAAWNICVPRDAWDADRVSVSATVFGWDLPAGTSPLDEARWWAGLLGAEVAEAPRTAGAIDLVVVGDHAGVPVEITLYVPGGAA